MDHHLIGTGVSPVGYDATNGFLFFFFCRKLLDIAWALGTHGCWCHLTNTRIQLDKFYRLASESLTAFIA
jgi:hypothetical protein